MNRLILLTLPFFILLACAEQTPPAPAPEPVQYVNHTVRYSGETLGEIASWYTGSSTNWKAIAEVNPGLKIKSIRVGDTIRIPQTLVRRNDPMPGESLEKRKVASTPKTTKKEQKQLAATTKQNTPPADQGLSTEEPQQVATESAEIANVAAATEAPTPRVETPTTQLYNGVMFSDPAMVRSALAAGADANHMETGRPMIGWAAQNGNVEIVKALLDAKADINLKDGVGHTALLRAADTDQLDVLKLLIDAKADLNAKSPRGETALVLAVKSGYVRCVRALAEAGADLNATDEDGDTAILRAAQDGNLEIIAILGAGKANLNVSNIIYTPLSYAIEQGQKDVVQALITAGADPNAKTNNGRAPLIIAIGNPEIFSLLLQAKADPNITNSSGDTALMAAIESDSKESIEALIKAGANINSKSTSGSTALTLAQNMSKTEIAELLKQHGATE